MTQSCRVCNPNPCKCPPRRMTKDEIIPTQNPVDTMDRDETDRLNRQRMVALMLRHNITIPTREFDKWRPTVETTGRIEGVSDGLMCIMTNGLLGYFLRADKEPLYGHMAHFMWDTPVVSYIPYLTPEGEERYFKSEKDQGVPAAFYKRTPKERPPKVRKAPKRTASAIKRANILANM
jgi:hypothetical protein